MSHQKPPGRTGRGGKGAGDGRVKVNKAYTTPRPITAALNYRIIACTSCGAPVNEQCVVKEGPRKGQPTTTIHPERKRMVNRLRNEAIARGEEQTITVRGTGKAPLKDRGHGLVTCSWCEHDVPVRYDGRLFSHNMNGGTNTRETVPCRGSGIKP